MGATFPRIKTWQEDEDVLTVDLNNEFNNLLNNLKPTGMDDHSLNVPQMQIQTNPGEVGTESLATSTAGELERLRYVISRIVGKSTWYQSPALSLEDVSNTLESAIGLPNNRIVSGKVTTAGQPGFLVAAGSSRVVTLQASALEPFVCFINGVQYSFQSNIVFNNLSVAPNSNHTCLADDARLSGQEWSKLKGEDTDVLTVSAMGSEITSVTGQFAAFKNTNAANEYFIAQVVDNVSLKKAKRGFFFNSSGNGIPRDFLSDNDIIQLMRLTWVFLNSSGTLEVTYRQPTYSGTEPSAPSIGDYWFDLGADQWKRYTATGFVTAGSLFVGYCVQDPTNCVAARSEDFFVIANDENSLFLEPRTTASVKTKFADNVTSVYGNRFAWKNSEIVWNYPNDLDSGVAQATSKTYYFYITNEGKPKITDVYPHNRLKDLRGWYHPHKPWAAIGGIYRDGSGNFDFNQIMSFNTMKDGDLVGRIEMIQDMYDPNIPNQGCLALIRTSFTQVARELFPRLYAKTGDRHGNGDGTNLFHLPDVAGMFPRFTEIGVIHDPDSAGRTALNAGGATGAVTGTGQATQNLSHAHGVSDPGHAHSFTQVNFAGADANKTAGGSSTSGVPTRTTSTSGTGVSIQASGGNQSNPANFYTHGYIKY